MYDRNSNSTISIITTNLIDMKKRLNIIAFIFFIILLLGLTLTSCKSKSAQKQQQSFNNTTVNHFYMVKWKIKIGYCDDTPSDKLISIFASQNEAYKFERELIDSAEKIGVRIQTNIIKSTNNVRK